MLYIDRQHFLKSTIKTVKLMKKQHQAVGSMSVRQCVSARTIRGEIWNLVAEHKQELKI